MELIFGYQQPLSMTELFLITQFLLKSLIICTSIISHMYNKSVIQLLISRLFCKRDRLIPPNSFYRQLSIVLKKLLWITRN